MHVLTSWAKISDRRSLTLKYYNYNTQLLPVLKHYTPLQGMSPYKTTKYRTHRMSCDRFVGSLQPTDALESNAHTHTHAHAHTHEHTHTHTHTHPHTRTHIRLWRAACRSWATQQRLICVECRFSRTFAGICKQRHSTKSSKFTFQHNVNIIFSKPMRLNIF